MRAEHLVPMDTRPLILLAPAVTPVHKSEAECFGAMVWLWMQSPTHRPLPQLST